MGRNTWIPLLRVSAYTDLWQKNSSCAARKQPSNPASPRVRQQSACKFGPKAGFMLPCGECMVAWGADSSTLVGYSCTHSPQVLGRPCRYGGCTQGKKPQTKKKTERTRMVSCISKRSVFIHHPHTHTHTHTHHIGTPITQGQRLASTLHSAAIQTRCQKNSRRVRLYLLRVLLSAPHAVMHSSLDTSPASVPNSTESTTGLGITGTCGVVTEVLRWVPWLE